MNTFEQNILTIFKEEGKLWLDNLPKQISALEDLWGLSQLVPYENLSYNYVLSGYRKAVPIVLKLSLDGRGLEKEANALEAFKGYGTVCLLEHKKDALLLEKADPGMRLKTFFKPPNDRQAIHIACQAIEKIHSAPLPKEGSFPHIREWLTALDREWDLPKFHLEKARELKNLLLKINSPEILLHGDLHQDNILSHHEGWLVIDPIGVMGSPIHEVWACIEDPYYDLDYVATYFNFPFEDLVKWYYVHLILAASWQVEDHLDPTPFLELAQSVLPLIRS